MIAPAIWYVALDSSTRSVLNVVIFSAIFKKTNKKSIKQWLEVFDLLIFGRPDIENPKM
jgi:hypothetical protein